MSGGYFEYRDTALCDWVFEYDLSSKYGKHKDESLKARLMNPLKDKDVSELTYDILCLLHSFDYWQSGDMQEKQYRSDVIDFKRKWLNGRNR